MTMVPKVATELALNVLTCLVKRVIVILSIHALTEAMRACSESHAPEQYP